MKARWPPVRQGEMRQQASFGGSFEAPPQQQRDQDPLEHPRSVGSATSRSSEPMTLTNEALLAPEDVLSPRKLQMAIPVEMLCQPSASGSTSTPRGDSLRPHAAGSVQVNACGKTFWLSGSASLDSVLHFKRSVREHLHMPGQDFSVQDVLGTPIVTDLDLKNAVVSKHTPLVATLSEAAVHFIENRREELSQMQWKLVRDELNTLSDRVAKLTRQNSVLKDALAESQSGQDKAIQALRHELSQCVETAAEGWRQNLLQVNERVESVAHLLSSERNARESWRQGLERSVQALRETVEGDKLARKAESSSTVSTLDNMHEELAQESRNRELLGERLVETAHRLGERMDALSRSQADATQDLLQQVKESETRMATEMQDYAMSGVKARATVENLEIEVRGNVQRVEDRTRALQSKLQEFMHRHDVHLQEIRFDKSQLQRSIDQVRSDERGHNIAMQSVLKQVGQLEERAQKREQERQDKQERQPEVDTQSQLLRNESSPAEVSMQSKDAGSSYQPAPGLPRDRGCNSVGVPSGATNVSVRSAPMIKIAAPVPTVPGTLSPRQAVGMVAGRSTPRQPRAMSPPPQAVLAAGAPVVNGVPGAVPGRTSPPRTYAAMTPGVPMGMSYSMTLPMGPTPSLATARGRPVTASGNLTPPPSLGH
eukprot:TRINITY_DN104509_c0_g1_i1.p1 TRINITY_DN104509_c0_g1~~TRINITY_DN104509_c0_g1_i1.p1  ORF type:complete len:656 (-),score=140.50 TRINITY_DN104509_c0_g1_i1:107-2074(-)